MTSEVQQRAIALLESLANKLGVTVEYLWPRLLWKVRVDWLAGVAATLTFALLAWFMLRYFQRRLEKSNNFDGYEIGLIFGYVFLVVALIMFCVQISTIGSLFFPEAEALSIILNR